MSTDEVIRAADEVLARATVGLAKAETVLADCTTRPLVPLPAASAPTPEEPRSRSKEELR